ncbi:hypothetical protein DM860_010936 [Cuscuta australis]|uniref:Membrane-associated kinase regulator 2 n=1 Tax=Cuscuta australis TaxID=267555 RepID=A0A328E0B4_9ASTE|nr:hypothetical protein DM860_010936 [Cuscuta australis]
MLYTPSFLPMEAFNLLKFWRGSGHYHNAGADVVSDDTDNSTKCTDDGNNPASESDDDDSENESFFDLVLDGADYICREEKEKSQAVKATRKGETGFDFPASPRDVFPKRNSSPVDSNVKADRSPISRLRSAPKFRVFFLGFKKTKSASDVSSPRSEQSKRFSVSCRVADSGTVVSSPPCRESSLRRRLEMEKSGDLSVDEPAKRFTRNPERKYSYLKLIKPLYGKSSKHSETSNLIPDKISATSALSPAREATASSRRLSGSRPAGFTAVRRHLVKSRSAAEAPAPARRRDDSLLEQNDGIQSAILHCKASYNSITPGNGGSIFSRSAGECRRQKSTDLQRRSI